MMMLSSCGEYPAYTGTPEVSLEATPFRIENTQRFTVVAGPCVIEHDGQVNRDVAAYLSEVFQQFPEVDFYFKSSYDKANRTSGTSYRGPGTTGGLGILADIKARYGVKLCSDVHAAHEVAEAADVLDMLQIPAFLCRQTDLLLAAGETGKPVQIKKGQFLSPQEVIHCANKVLETGNRDVFITERGTTFGYNNLVVDMRSIPIVSSFGLPILLDATHSCQAPGGLNGKSGGNRNYAPMLARAAVAAGCHGLFFETHPDPDKALSDGPNQIPLSWVEPMIRQVLAIRAITT
ncbi:MAG: 3-deoxy-8-phosphooctulonate synthase [Vampirovibrionales bacterium]